MKMTITVFKKTQVIKINIVMFTLPEIIVTWKTCDKFWLHKINTVSCKISILLPHQFLVKHTTHTKETAYFNNYPTFDQKS